MIDLKVTSVGGPEIAREFADAAGALRASLRNELSNIGDEIVNRARSMAPRRSGVMASRIIWEFGRRSRRGRGVVVETQGVIEFTAMPTGRVAHLVERGVSATFDQRVGLRGKVGGVPRKKKIAKALWGEASQKRYGRTLNIAPRPFFMPAVEAVGGAAGVNARLQAAVDRVAAGKVA